MKRMCGWFPCYAGGPGRPPGGGDLRGDGLREDHPAAQDLSGAGARPGGPRLPSRDPLTALIAAEGGNRVQTGPKYPEPGAHTGK